MLDHPMSLEGCIFLYVLGDECDMGWWADVSVFWDLVSRLSHKGPCGNVCIK